MANRKNTFLLKRSNTPGKVPTAGDLQLGELALNTADVILYASGTTANDILPIGWDRVARTGDTMTGTLYVPYLNIKNFTGTTAIAGLAIDANGNVITGSTATPDTYTTGGTYSNGTAIFTNNTGGTFSVSGFYTGLTFSGTSNYYSRFTSGGTISNGIIWDDGISGVNFMGTENTAINIISPVGYYYPSLVFYNNGGNLTGSITGYGSELYINGGLKVHPNYINLPYHTPNTLLYTDATNYVKPVTIGSNLSFSTGGTLSVTGLTGGMIFTGGTVTGSTNFTNGVTANTYTVNQLYGLTAQTAQTVNLELADQWEYTLTGNTTFTFSNNANGKSWTVAVSSNPTTSGYTSSFTATTANVKWAYGITPVQTATVNKTDIYSFIQLNGVIYGDYSQSY